jgi:hypothetical protein
MTLKFIKRTFLGRIGGPYEETILIYGHRKVSNFLSDLTIKKTLIGI